VRRAELLRTARKLMDGRVYVAAGRLAMGTPLHDNKSLPEWWTSAGW